MNEIITNLMCEWGFNMPSNIFTPMVYIISTIAFCLVFWIICKVVSPNASSMRTFVMKYVCVVMAVVVCLSCVATNGITINVDTGENFETPETPEEPNEPSAPTLKAGYFIVKGEDAPVYTKYIGEYCDRKNSVETTTLSIVCVAAYDVYESVDITINGDPITLNTHDCIIITAGNTVEVISYGVVSVTPITTYTIQNATE